MRQCGAPDYPPNGLAKLYSHVCKLDVAPETIHQLATQIRAGQAALCQLRGHLNRLDVVNSSMENLDPPHKDALAEMDKNQ